MILGKRNQRRWGNRRHRGPKTVYCRPGVEVLEERWLPAGLAGIDNLQPTAQTDTLGPAVQQSAVEATTPTVDLQVEANRNVAVNELVLLKANVIVAPMPIGTLRPFAYRINWGDGSPEFMGMGLTPTRGTLADLVESHEFNRPGRFTVQVAVQLEGMEWVRQIEIVVGTSNSNPSGIGSAQYEESGLFFTDRLDDGATDIAILIGSGQYPDDTLLSYNPLDDPNRPPSSQGVAPPTDDTDGEALLVNPLPGTGNSNLPISIARLGRTPEGSSGGNEVVDDEQATAEEFPLDETLLAPPPGDK